MSLINTNWGFVVQGFAKELLEEVKTLGIPVEVIDMKDYDPDDQLADEVTYDIQYTPHIELSLSYKPWWVLLAPHAHFSFVSDCIRIIVFFS